MSVEYVTVDAGLFDFVAELSKTREQKNLDAAVKAHGSTYPLVNLLRMEVCKKQKITHDKILKFKNDALVKWLRTLHFDADADMFEKVKFEKVKFDGEILLGAEEQSVKTFYQKHYPSNNRDEITKAAETLLGLLELLEKQTLTVGSGPEISEEQAIKKAAEWILNVSGTRTTGKLQKEAMRSIPKDVKEVFEANERSVLNDSNWMKVCEMVAKKDERANRRCLGEGTIGDRILSGPNYGAELKQRIVINLNKNQPTLLDSLYNELDWFPPTDNLPTRPANPYGSYPEKPDL